VLPALVILCREILVSGLREYLAGLRVGLPVSRLAKWKTAIQMVAIGVLIVGDAGWHVMPVVAIGETLLWLAALLTLVTGYDYLRAGLSHIAGPPRRGRGKPQRSREMRIFGLAGWSGSGKTTLLTALIPELVGRGVTVSTIKHAHHEFDIDKPGKDSWLHRQAGASEVMVASSRRFALMHELRDAPEPTLDELVARMAPVDLLLVEGFQGARSSKARSAPAVGRKTVSLSR
jgi:molybdopterin-guanine dinucleotide biosynthesis protein MobB